MKKVYLSLILMFLVSIFVLGCGGEEISTDKLKFKASNVVFRSRASDEFTNQKVYADDVVLNNANTSLTADNVQGAFEETQPKLSEIIVGEWDVVCYKGSFAETVEIKTGTITFNTDKTFSFTGVGKEFASSLTTDNTVIPIKYEIYNDSLIGITSEWNPDSGSNKISQIRDFNVIKTDKLISKRTSDPFDYIYIFVPKVN